MLNRVRLNRIRFNRCDEHFRDMEKKADDLAGFLILHKEYFPYIIVLIRASVNWNTLTYKEELSAWKGRVLGRSKLKNPDAHLFIIKAEALFRACKHNDEIQKARGIVPEKIAAKLFKIRYSKFGNNCNHGYGCSVIVDGTEITYTCKVPFEDKHHDSDANRKTVDVGVWNGIAGEFLEIKVSPSGFHTKDINYLRKLSSNLKGREINYTIYLVSLEDKDLAMMRLKKLKLWHDDEFTLIGHTEFLDFHKAI